MIVCFPFSLQLRRTGIGEAEAGAGEAARGPCDGGEDKRVRVFGVFGQVEGGRPRGVRDGDTGRVTGEEKEKDPVSVAVECGSRAAEQESLRCVSSAFFTINNNNGGREE